MAKEIISDAAEQSDGDAYRVRGIQQFEGVVFKRLPAIEDFSCSAGVVLPGQHTAEGAWTAVYAAIEAGGPDFIGGEIRPCIEQLAR